MDAEAWDQRYAASELVWSREPNQFVAAELADLPPGHRGRPRRRRGPQRDLARLARLVGDAVDFSQVALDKGARLAGGGLGRRDLGLRRRDHVAAAASRSTSS